MAFKGLVSVDDSDGRVSVADGNGFNARFVDGVWEVDKTFSADDFKDNFRLVFDEATANALLKEAKASLGMK